MIGYFVICLQFVFYGDKDFDYFYYVWRQIVVLMDFFDFVVELVVQCVFQVVELLVQCFDFFGGVFFGYGKLLLLVM